MDNKEFNYLEQENELIKKLFNLDEILALQLKHDIQIIRGADYQYCAYIDHSIYGSALTPMGALVFGLKVFIQHSKK